MRSPIALPRSPAVLVALPAVLAATMSAGCNNDKGLNEVGGEEAVFEMTTPTAADWVDAGSVSVSGTAQNVQSVTLSLAPDGDEVAATRTGENWNGNVKLARGVNVIQATAVDLRDDTLFKRHGVLAGDFANPDNGVNDALSARVNQGGLDKIGELVAAYMTPELVTSSVTAMNPVYADSYSVFGFDAVEVYDDINVITYDSPEIAFSPSNGLLTLTATLPNLYVGTTAYGTALGYDFSSDVSMTASSAIITASIAVDVVDGQIDVTLTSCAVELKDFAYDTSLLPSYVTDYLLVETIRDTVEEMLVEKIQTLVPELLGSTLSGLDPSFSTDILGYTVDMAFGFANADIDSDGIVIDLDVDVAMDAGGDKSYVGYLAAPVVSPSVDRHADIAAGFSDNVLNMVLFQAWRAGLLDMSLSTTDGSLDPSMLTLLKADEGTISTSASLPPVMVESDDGNVQAQVTELLVTIDTPGGGLGDHIVIAMSLWVEIELTIQDGALVLSLGEPTVVMDVRESDWGASNEATTNLLADALPVDVILALLGDISVPLPSLYGITIDSGEAERDDNTYWTDATVYLQ